MNHEDKLQGDPYLFVKSSWGPCSKKCSINGRKTMTRTIVKPLTDLFAKPCPKNMSHSTQCGIENNGCKHFCNKENGECGCKNGFVLSKDNKTCIDRNECKVNFGRGPCVQKCINTIGSYKCECNPNFNLDADNHNCVFNTSATPCVSKIRKFDDNGNCICKVENLEGLKCNKDKNACNTVFCSSDAVCIKFLHSKQSCLERKPYLVPILHPMPFQNFIKKDFRYVSELYIAEILEGIKPKDPLYGDIGQTKRVSNDIEHKYFYVEANTMEEIKSFTFVEYAVFSIEDFEPVPREMVCSKLEDTDVHCLSSKECNILKTEGQVCPFVHKGGSHHYQNSTGKSKVWIPIVICLSILVLLILVVICFMRKRGKWHNMRMLFTNRDEEVVCSAGGNETLLQTVEPPPPYSTEDENIQHIENFDASVFKDELLRKDNDPVYESIPGIKLPDYQEYESMNNCRDKKCDRVEIPDNSDDDDQPRYVVPQRIVSNNGQGNSSACPSTENEPHYMTTVSNKPLSKTNEMELNI